jgi:tetratricopeptide (TPR) repeat protein
MKGKRAREETRAPLPRRLSAKLALAVVVPALLLAGTEFFLRFAGYGFPSSPFIRLRTEAGGVYGSNPRFSWRFFPREIARTMSPFVFSASKRSGTVRIFVLGSSAAQGTPDPSFSFGRILRVMLETSYPQKRFEVITAAMPAINSHVVLPLARACVEHEPDLVIVYTGNNEVLGPYGAGTVFSPLKSDLRAIRLNIALRGLRLGQLAAALRERKAAPSGAPNGWRGLEMFLEKEVPAGDPRLQTVYRHFESNIEDLARTLLSRGVPVVLCTLACNLKDCPPFAAHHREGLGDEARAEWDRLVAEGDRLEASGDAAAAFDAYRRAAAIDDRHAELVFRMGRCEAGLGRTREAQASFVRARDLDTLRFRVDSRLNDILRSVAAREEPNGVRLADIERIASEKGPPGNDLFLEHVHFNFDGNYLVARSLFDPATALLSSALGSPAAKAPPSRDECADALAFTAWERARIEQTVRTAFLERPPFTNQLGHEDRIRDSEEREQALRKGFGPDAIQAMLATYRRAVALRPEDESLRVKHGLFLADAVADSTQAEAEFRAALKLVPHDGEAFSNLGYVLGRTGRLDEAEKECRRAVRILPYSPDALYNLGLALHLKAGQERRPELAMELTEEAIRFYTQSLACNPVFAQAWNNKGVLLLRLRRVDESLESFKAGIEAEPEHLDLRYNYAVALNAAGRTDAAIAQLRAALKAHPDSQKLREALQQLRKASASP